MRQLHSGLELEITRLNQQNKVLSEENSKMKKVSNKNKDLKNEVSNLKSHLALEKAKLQTKQLGFEEHMTRKIGIEVSNMPFSFMLLLYIID